MSGRVEAIFIREKGMQKIDAVEAVEQAGLNRMRLK